MVYVIFIDFIKYLNRGFMIKKIEVQEINEIIDIEKESFNEAWTIEVYQSLYKNYKTDVYAWYEKEQVIAYAVFLDMVDVNELVRIAVKKEFRGKKYGSDFLRKILNNFDKNIFLEVRQNNVSAIKLYENTGFKLVNIRKDYYSDTHENALVMVYDK